MRVAQILLVGITWAGRPISKTVGETRTVGQLLTFVSSFNRQNT